MGAYTGLPQAGPALLNFVCCSNGYVLAAAMPLLYAALCGVGVRPRLASSACLVSTMLGVTDASCKAVHNTDCHVTCRGRRF